MKSHVDTRMIPHCSEKVNSILFRLFRLFLLRDMEKPPGAGPYEPSIGGFSARATEATGDVEHQTPNQKQYTTRWS